MRNLKKVFAVVVAIALVLMAMAPAFAADNTTTTTTTATAATEAWQLASQIGMLKGDTTSGTPSATYLASTPTRLQSIIMILRLKGLEQDALSFTGKDNFADAADVDWDGGKAIMAYVKANGDKLGIQGVGNNKLDPNSAIDAQSYYKVMLEALGFKQDKDFKWEEVLTFAAKQGLSLAAGSKNFTIKDLSTATVEALQAKTSDGKTTLADQLVAAKVLKSADADAIAKFVPAGPVGPVAYKDLVAATASSLAIKFASPVANTKNITVSVKRGPIDETTMTQSWDKDNKTLTLSKDTKLVTGDYTVSVKDGTKDLGSKTVTVEQEKLAKVEVTSDTLIRYEKAVNDDHGVANYKAYNQYGDDITDSALASSLQWYVGLPNTTYVADHGILDIKSEGFSTSNYFYYKEVTVTGNDLSSGVTTSKTLKISDTFGDIGSIKLSDPTNPDGALPRINAPETFYIGYDIKDSNGNPITNLDVLENTVTLNISNTDIISSCDFEEDPVDTNKAVIALKFKANSTYNYDTMVSITAFSKFSGKSDTLNMNIKKELTVNKFMLQPPSAEVAANEQVQIPFVAYDQDGTVMTDDVFTTKANDSTDNVQFSISGPGGYTIDKDYTTSVDKLYMSFTRDGIYTVTANVKDTGNFNQITINVRAQAVPTSLKAIDTNVIVPAIAQNGVVYADFNNYPAFTVLDQYDREFNLKEKYAVGTTNYYLKAAQTAQPGSSDYLDVSVTDNNGSPAGTDQVNSDKMFKITDTDGVSGTATIKFQLFGSNDPTRVLDEKIVTIRKVEDKDVVGYDLQKPDAFNNMYQNKGALYNPATAQGSEYDVPVDVVGKLAGGSKVAIDPADIKMVTLSNGDNFAKVDPSMVDGRLVYQVYAKNTEDADETGVVTAVVQGYNTTYSVTANAKAFYAKPQAKTVTADANYSTGKITQHIGDTFFISAADFNAGMNGRTMAKYDATGAKTNALIWFDVTDQYNGQAASPSYFVADNDAFKVDPATGVVTVKNASITGSFDVTAVAENGTTKTITIKLQ